MQIAAAAGRMLSVRCLGSIGLDLDIEAAVLAPRSLFLERLSVWRDQESVSGERRLLAGLRDLPIEEHHQSGNRTKSALETIRPMTIAHSTLPSILTS